MSRRNPFRQSRAACTIACMGLLALAGCGKQGLDVVPVKGTIFYKGEPLANFQKGGVTYFPEDDAGDAKGYLPQSSIDVNGNYELFTNGLPGAIPGRYKVAVNTAYAMPPAKYLAPVRYAIADQSGFRIEVKRGAPKGYYDLRLEEK